GLWISRALLLLEWGLFVFGSLYFRGFEALCTAYSQLFTFNSHDVFVEMAVTQLCKGIEAFFACG
ncbi:MAG: hypothetical protein WAZ36_03540, partial [Sediminibacterium sp.]